MSILVVGAALLHADGQTKDVHDVYTLFRLCERPAERRMLLEYYFSPTICIYIKDLCAILYICIYILYICYIYMCVCVFKTKVTQFLDRP